MSKSIAERIEAGPISKLFPDARPVTHDEARDAAQDLIDHFFKNKPREGGGVLISIPARADNTDLILMRYIEQQRAQEAHNG